MIWCLVYTKKADADLRHLERADAQRILRKLEHYAASDNPLHFAKKLKPPFDDVYRFRIGDYRVIFHVDTAKQQVKILLVLRVRHRKDVYSH